ncbi:MAG TPA: hypothetical protein VF100_10870 [Thermoanaerobaculia bacterium]
MRKLAAGFLAAAAVVVVVGSAAAAGPDLAKLLDEAGLEYETRDGGRLRVIYEFDDGRSQLVSLQPQGEFEGVDVVEIYAPVMRLREGTVPAVLGRRLLEENGRKKLTYFGVEEVEGTLMVFCYHNTPTAGLDAKTLAALLLGVATFADEMEKEQLGVGSDEF